MDLVLIHIGLIHFLTKFNELSISLTLEQIEKEKKFNMKVLLLLRQNPPPPSVTINVQQIFREVLQTRRSEACWRASPILAPRAVYGNAEFNKLFSTPCH